MNIALIVFAGSGTRIHSEVPKQFVKVNGTEMVCYTIKRFQEHPLIDEIVLVTSKDYLPLVSSFKDKFCFTKVKHIAEGGATRQESVRKGLEATNYHDEDLILIHDGDRPLVSNLIINQCLFHLGQYDAVCPYILSKDALQEVSNSGRKIKLDNEDADIQTPQGFKYGLIKRQHSLNVNNAVSDDIALIEGVAEVKYFVGDKDNFKVTEDKDLEYLKTRIK